MYFIQLKDFFSFRYKHITVKIQLRNMALSKARFSISDRLGGAYGSLWRGKIIQYYKLTSTRLNLTRLWNSYSKIRLQRFEEFGDFLKIQKLENEWHYVIFIFNLEIPVRMTTWNFKLLDPSGDIRLVIIICFNAALIHIT